MSSDTSSSSIAAPPTAIQPPSHEADSDPPSASASDSTAVDSGATEPELLCRGHRKQICSTRLADFVTNTVHSTPFPIEHFVSCTGFSETHKAYLFAITNAKEPKSYAQAVKDENCR